MSKIKVFLMGVMAVVISVMTLASVGIFKNPGPVIPDGNVVGIHPGTALYIMDQALSGRVGYQIFENAAIPGANLWIGAIRDDGVGFVLTGNTSGVRDIINCGGNIANCRTVSSLVEWAKSTGWKLIPASDIPVNIRIAVKAAITARVALAAVNETAFVFIPAGAFSNIEEYTSWKTSDWK